MHKATTNLSASAKLYQPLAIRMRPRKLDEFIGQEHLLAAGKPLRCAIENKILHSMILWGPPGTGKTTLAHLLATSVAARVESISAVLSGVKEIREIVKRAKNSRETERMATILFVDEVHRFNKAQQDAFLPYVEEGLLTLIGATTENPSFELNSALLSRARVYVLKRLQENEILRVIDQALADSERGLGKYQITLPTEIRQRIAQLADGDARRALNFLELGADASAGEWQAILTDGLRRFDKHGELFYDQISALHKAVRGSDPDATLYWLCRMLDGGCDPLYLGRRMLRMASEDIGNADPRALTLALEAVQVYERLGTPEGELALAQAVIYLAVAPKSNACYVAFNAAMSDVKEHGTLEVPLHLRNAPTRLMKNLGYGKGYRYAHDEPDGYAAGESYLPENLPKHTYYRPVNRGLEIKIGEKLKQLKEFTK